MHDRYEEERRHDRNRRGGHSPAEVGRNEQAPKPDECVNIALLLAMREMADQRHVEEDRGCE